MKVGFTGSSTPVDSAEQVIAVTTLLEELYEPESEFHHGCCVGWDEQAAEIARAIGYELVGHPPTNTKKKSSIKNDRDFPPLPYPKRNRVIVNGSTIMIAAPRQDVEVARGTRGEGTWMTIWYARDKDKSLLIVWPDGEVTL